MTDTITISVPQELAEAFNRADPPTRERIERAVHDQLENFLFKPRRTLEEVMNDMGRHAAANGMTEEIFADIMREYQEERRRQPPPPKGPTVFAPITIPVSPEVVAAYVADDNQLKRKVNTLVRLQLDQYLPEPRHGLFPVLDSAPVEPVREAGNERRR